MAVADGSRVHGTDDQMQVVLTIVEARGLKGTSLDSTSECCCTCWVQGDKEDTEFSTDAVRRSADASWEHQITLPEWVRGQTLEFEVWDQDGLSHRDVLGKAELLLSPDLCAASRAVEQSLPLKCDGGAQGMLLVMVEGAPPADEPQDGAADPQVALREADGTVASGAGAVDEPFDGGVESEAALEEADGTVAGMAAEADESQDGGVESDAALWEAGGAEVGGAADGDDRTRCCPGLGLGSAASASTVEGEESPVSPEVSALAALLQRRSAGSLLRGWRRHFDPEGAAQVRRQRFVQGCGEVGGLHLAKPIWHELSLDGRTLAFSSLFPREQARLESLAAVLFPALGADLENVWEFLDGQHKNRLCFRDFEKGVNKLGFRCNVKPIFDGILNGPVFVFKEDFLYLRLFFWSWLQSVPGGADNTLAALFSHVRQELGGPEAFMKRLGLSQDEAISEHEFAARLSAIGFLGDPVLVARHLAKMEKRVCNGTEIYASSLSSLLSDEGHRTSPKTPLGAGLCETPRGPKTSARAGPCETPRTPRSQLSGGLKTSARSQLSGGEPVEWVGVTRDVSHHNRGKHPDLRTYFSQPVREEDEHEGASRSNSPGGAGVAQPAAHCAPDHVPLLALPAAGEAGGPRAGGARAGGGLQRAQTAQAAPRPQRAQRAQTTQLSQGEPSLGSRAPSRPRVPRCQMLHFEATKLRGGQSGYKAKLEAVVFYRGGEPVRPASVSKVPYIVTFDKPMEVDELRFQTRNADPSLDIIRWHVWGSTDGEVWFDLHDQEEDFPTRHGCLVKQLLVGDEEHDMLRVNVIEATGLKNNASSKNRGVSDPYCSVWIDKKADTKVHTEVFMTSQSPKWDARLEVHGYKVGDDVRIMVRHSRYGLSSKTSIEDTLLGEARIPSSVLSPNGFDGWVDLEKGTGRVNLRIRPLKEACISEVHRIATTRDPLELWLCDTLGVDARVY